jgi:hypothetical protein
VPDLRYTPALRSRAYWDAVVDRGALESKGMVAFGSVLSARQQAAIREYLIQRAQQSYLEKSHASGTGGG